MTNAILRGKPDAGNPHVRFDEGEVASAKPRRGSLLYKLAFNKLAAAVAIVGVVVAGDRAFAGSEYRFAEYVERVDSSTISTGIKITDNTTKVEFGVQDKDGGTASLDKKLMGDSSEKFGFATLGGAWRVLSQGYSQGGPAKDKNRIDVTVTGTSSGTSWTIVRAEDGASGTPLAQGKFYASGNPLCIFGLGGNVGAPAGFRFFYMKHYETIEGVEKLSNFVVPVERLSDHQAGLYDIVTGAFFAPSSGTVVLGEAVNDMLGDMLEVAGAPTARGTVSPAYGVHVGYPDGTSVTATSTATWTREDGEATAKCVGYKVYTNNVEWMSGTFTGDEERSVSFTRPKCAEGVKLEWLWDEQCHVTVGVSGGGSIRGVTDVWTKAGETFTVEAVPDEGRSFESFSGDVPADKRYDNPLTFTLKGPTAITAHFAKGMSSPSVVREKSVFWLDAMNDSTLLCDENNLVTNWVSRASGEMKCATVPDVCLAPTNDTTHYDIATVDFGKVSSNVDMVFPRITNVRTIFFVVRIAKTQSAFLIGDSAYYQFHRGGSGEYGNSTYCSFEKLWDRGDEVSAWSSTAIPADSFRVIAIRTKSNCSISSLTRDRGGIDGRSGGRQLSELIVFDEPLDDSQVATVSSYLMRKWGFAKERIAVVGNPDAHAGYPTPFYGDAVGYKSGDSVAFSLPGTVFTNDSRTFATELTGWTFLDSDGNRTDGTGLGTTMTYGERLMYSTFTWNWSGDWTRVVVKEPRPSKLPTLYREVEYLETGADGSVATGIKLTTETSEVALRFGVSDSVVYPAGDADDSKWFGAATDYDKTMFAFGHYRGTWRILARHNWNSPSCYSSSRGPLDVVIRGKSWSFLDPADGTYSRVTATYPLVGETDSATTIGIFGGTGLRAPAGVRFYRLRIWERGVLVHDLVPCCQRRDATSRQPLPTPVPGVCDRVTGEFHAGKGTLACGPETPVRGGLAVTVR